MKLLMTLLVRNEADIIEENLLFHLNQGVDHFVVTDNLSTDSTPDVLQRYVSSGVVTLIQQEADDYSQSVWVTEMARRSVREFAADWVINSDADEFWLAEGGSLKAQLSRVSEEFGVVSVARHNFVPIGLQGVPLSQMIYRESRSTNALGHPLPQKVCHRGFEDVVVEQGNHSISAPLAASTTAEIEILHYPARSYSQFESKIRNGGQAYARNTSLKSEVGGTWKYLYQELCAGRLLDYYSELARSVELAEQQVSTGELVIDRRLRERS
jgi:Glycosyl transferase family 2